MLAACLLPIIVDFLYIHILQGSVATQLKCGKLFNNQFIANSRKMCQ